MQVPLAPVVLTINKISIANPTLVWLATPGMVSVLATVPVVAFTPHRILNTTEPGVTPVVMVPKPCIRKIVPTCKKLAPGVNVITAVSVLAIATSATIPATPPGDWWA